MNLRLLKEYLPVILIIFISANVADIIYNKVAIYSLLGILWVLFLAGKYRTKKIILYVLTIWVLINLFSFLYNQTANSFLHGTSIKSSIYMMLISYFLIVLSGRDIFLKLEKIIFFLTVLSFPFYTAEWLMPTLMKSITTPISCLRDSSGSWYIGVYYHLKEFTGGLENNRNSGFMWEPGAFAFMIILGVVIHFRKNGVHFDKRFLIYMIAMSTTLSTMGYLVSFILIGLILRRMKWYASAILILILLFSLPTLLDLDFLVPEIESHISNGEAQQVGRDSRTGILRINRYAAFVLAIDETKQWPLGYGVIKSKNLIDSFGEVVVGVGAVQYTLIKWGLFGFVFMIISLRKSIMKMNFRTPVNPFSLLFMHIALLMGLFSNPLESTPVFYMLVLFPYLYKVKVKRLSYVFQNQANSLGVKPAKFLIRGFGKNSFLIKR